MPGLFLGSIFPNYTFATTVGEINFHDWIGDSWCVFFTHPADFTPVCTTELARAELLYPQFEKRNVKLIAYSIDSVQIHQQWENDISCFVTAQNRHPISTSTKVNVTDSISSSSRKISYPIIAGDRDTAAELGILDPEELNSDGIPLTARAAIVIDPMKKVKASILYPATTGRNFDEIIRLIDGLQFTYNDRYLATPVDWQPGQHVILAPNIPQNNQYFDESEINTVSLPSGKHYLRVVNPKK